MTSFRSDRLVEEENRLLRHYSFNKARRAPGKLRGADHSSSLTFDPCIPCSNVGRGVTKLTSPTNARSRQPRSALALDALRPPQQLAPASNGRRTLY